MSLPNWEKYLAFPELVNLRTYQTALPRCRGTAFIRRRFAAHVSPEADCEVSRIRLVDLAG
jgi:hypothetical protein